MIVSFDKVFKSFGGSYILEDISFKIEPEDKIGLIGVNGAGKTTLLNMLLGECLKDKGEINVAKGLSIGFLKQINALDSTDTILQEMQKCFLHLDKIREQMDDLETILATTQKIADKSEYEKLSNRYTNLQSYFENNGGYDTSYKIKTILNGMGFADKSPDTVISTLSGGEKTRLALAKLLLQNPQLLILDEPTNHLDFKTLFWLEDYLSNYKGAIFVVSHDRFFLDKITNKTFEIQRKSLLTYKGNYSKYLILKKEQYDRQLKEYKAQQEKMADLKDYVAKNIVRASTSASAKSRQKELEKMEIINKPYPPEKSARFDFCAAYDTVKDLLTVANLSLSVGSGASKKHLFSDVNLEVKKNEKIAIIGPNGAGKTSFLKALQNLLIPEKGTVKWGKNARIGYYEQEGLTLDQQNTVIDELWKYAPLKKQLEIRNALGNVLLTGENVFKKVCVLSGGEKARLSFAILSFRHGNVLILDEPTNHLDLPTKEALEQALCAFDGTLIIVSHDRYMLTKVPTKIIELESSGITQYPGNYESYLLQTAAKNISASAANSTVSKKQNKSEFLTTATEKPQYKSKQQRSNIAKLRQQKSLLELKSTQLEQEIKFLEHEITLPEVYSNFEKMQEKCDLIESSKAEYEDIFEQLLETEELLS